MDRVDLECAIRIAANALRDQVRGDGVTAAILHPIGVMSILSDAGIVDPPTLMAALNHDTLEDCVQCDRLNYAMQLRALNERVLSLVEEVSDPIGFNREQKREWKLRTCVERSYGAKLITLADSCHNLRSLVYSPPKWSGGAIRSYIAFIASVGERLVGTHAVLEGMFIEALRAAQAKHPTLVR